MDDVSSLLSRLERWLKKHRPHYLRALLPAMSVAESKELTSLLGRALPVSLPSLLRWHNGQQPDVVGCFEQNWRLMSSTGIMDALKDLTTAVATAVPADLWDPALVPFLDDDSGNYLCLDTSQSGEPVREVILGDSNREILAPSLAAWLADFVAAVEKGGYTEDEERGAFMRKIAP
jgi:cell wall assembly regulator SMI1